MGIPEKTWWKKKWKNTQKIPKNTKIGDFIEEKGEMDIEREIFFIIQVLEWL
jgi:hypothetical protein